MSISTPSVVERASKEISRRMHNLGFNRSSSKESTSGSAASTGSSASSPSPTPSKKLVLSESDKLNGNSENPDPDGASGGGQPEASSSSVGGSGAAAVLRKKPVCPAAKQPAARASMGSIIKGSVMEKVTHVFNNGVNMGNSNSNSATNKQPLKAKEASPPTEVNAAAGSNDPKRNNSSTGVGGNTAPGINIPKGEIRSGQGGD